MNHLKISAETIANDLQVDCDNYVIFNRDLYEKEIARFGRESAADFVLALLVDRKINLPASLPYTAIGEEYFLKLFGEYKKRGLL